MARDCPDRARGADFRNLPPRDPQNAIDSDYENMMKAISGGADSTANASRQIGWEGGVAPQGDANGGAPPRGPAPWQKGPTGAPAPWQQRQEPTGGPAPWQQRSRDNYQGHQGGYNGGYNAGPPAAPWAQGGGGGGVAPWQQPQQQPNYGYGAPPGMNAPPPPPPSYEAPPPPPPSDIPPPPPPS